MPKVLSRIALIAAIVLGNRIATAQIVGQAVLPQYGAAYAQVRVCPYTGSGSPCSPLSTIYSDPAETQVIPNPFTADQYGNFSIYAPSGSYIVQITPIAGITYSYVTNGILNFNGANTFTGNNTFSGSNLFSGNNTFTGSDSFVTTTACTFSGAPYINTGCFSNGDLGAQVNAAVLTLPTYTSKPAGTIYLPPNGSYSYSTPIVIGTYTTLDCQNSILTFNGATGTSAMTSTDAPTTYGGEGGIRNCQIFLTANNQTGITVNETTYNTFQNNTIYGSGYSANQIGILLSNTQKWTERNVFINNHALSMAVSYEMADNCSGHSGCGSFAYSIWLADYASPAGGGVGYQLQNDAGVNGGYYQITCSGGSAGGITCLNIINTASLNLASLNIGGEQGSAVTASVGISAASGTTYAPNPLREVWNNGTWTDSISSGYICISCTPNQGHVLLSTSGVAFTNTTNAYSATLDGTGLSQNGDFKVPNVASDTLVGIAATQTLTNKTLTTPTLSGLTNGTGIQLFNTTTTCTTSASAGATCTTSAISLPVGYSDTNYRVNCTGLSPTNTPVVQAVTKSNTSFTITIMAVTAAAGTFSSYDCVAEHN